MAGQTAQVNVTQGVEFDTSLALRARVLSLYSLDTNTDQVRGADSTPRCTPRCTLWEGTDGGNDDTVLRRTPAVPSGNVGLYSTARRDQLMKLSDKCGATCDCFPGRRYIEVLEFRTTTNSTRLDTNDGGDRLCNAAVVCCSPPRWLPIECLDCFESFWSVERARTAM